MGNREEMVEAIYRAIEHFTFAADADRIRKAIASSLPADSLSTPPATAEPSTDGEGDLMDAYQPRWSQDPFTPDTHEREMDTIRSASSVTILSYEEAVACYLRARGILRDDAELMCSPVPPGWTPPLPPMSIGGGEDAAGGVTSTDGSAA
jgi:hypothetical protein